MVETNQSMSILVYGILLVVNMIQLPLFSGYWFASIPTWSWDYPWAVEEIV